MPPRRLVIAFLAMWISLGLVVLAASARTVLSAHEGRAHGPGNLHLEALAGVEALAALLFLVPRTMRVGGAGLLATFAVAMAAHGLTGEFPMVIALYAAATAFVMVHGPVPWHAAFGARETARSAMRRD
jgi:hypothetical protein